MNTTLEAVTLDSRDEYRRLWAGALKAYDSAAEILVSLSEALDLGIRAAEILFTHKLHPIRSHFPASIESLLEEPALEVDVDRDALHVPATLQFVDAMDMLSDPQLTCVSRQLHRGWEDPRASCFRSRGKAQSVTGITLSEEARHRLLLLLAHRNRIFRMSPPVKIVVPEVLGAYPALVDLMEGLKRTDR